VLDFLNFNLINVVSDELEQQEGSMLFTAYLCGKINGPLSHCFVETHYEQNDKNEM
jgi:hypothetical protein